MTPILIIRSAEQAQGSNTPSGVYMSEDHVAALKEKAFYDYLEQVLSKREKPAECESAAHSEPQSEDRFVSPCPQPKGFDAEVLDILIEEAAEVIQRVTKMKRFGIEEVQPGQDLTNAERLSQELGDLMGTMQLAVERGLVSPTVLENQIPIKISKLRQFMQNEPEGAQ